MLSSPDSLKERQENELQLLEAIYVNDVTDLRNQDAWKVKINETPVIYV